MTVKKMIPVLSLLLLSTAGCRFNYEENQAADDLSEDIPETILINMKQTSVRSGKEAYVFEAERTETYKQRNQTLIQNVQFYEYNTKGEVVTEGTAEKAVLFTKTEDAEVTGAMKFRSTPNEAVIEADYLYWTKESRNLTGQPDKFVKVTKDDGTEIQGKDFQADMARLRFQFGAETEGRFVSEEEDEEANSKPTSPAPPAKLQKVPIKEIE